MKFSEEKSIMALPYKTGTWFSRSRGVIDAIEKELKLVNLKPAKKLTFTFNPFHEKVYSIRNASWFLYRESVRKTNLKCIYKTSVHNSLEEPLLEVKLESGQTVLFKTSDLTAVDILKKFNELVSSKHKEN